MPSKIDWQPVVLVVLLLGFQLAIMAMLVGNAVTVYSSDARLERIELRLGFSADEQTQ